MKTRTVAWSCPLLLMLSFHGTPPARAQLLGPEVKKQLLELDFETLQRRARENAPGEYLLPDLVVSREDLRDLRVQALRSAHPHLVCLRLSFAAVNIGRGPLELDGGEAKGSVREVRQRIYSTNGRSRDRRAGDFIHHPEHRHVHFQNWAQWRLREVTRDGGIGAILAEGQKTSFCVEDTAARFEGLEGFSPRPRYRDCGMGRQGLSVGWADVYDKSIHGQWLDITRLEPGAYWLEVEVDPDDLILESNEGNNAARVKIFYSRPDGDFHVTAQRPLLAQAGDSVGSSKVDTTPDRSMSRPEYGDRFPEAAGMPRRRDIAP